MSPFTSRESFTENGGLTVINPSDLNDDKICYICLDPYHSPSNVPGELFLEDPIRLPCGHIFGSSCILRWTLERNTCPYCRTKLFDTHASPVDSTFFDTSAIVPGGADVYTANTESMDTSWERLWLQSLGVDDVHVHFGPVDGPLGGVDLLCADEEEVPFQAAPNVSPRPPYQPGPLFGVQDLTLGQYVTILQGLASATPLSSSYDEDDPEVEHQIEHEIADLDVQMGDLVGCHEEWMSEYKDHEELDVDEDEDEEESCC
ncbi:hypothetical protein K505DRAFT_367389 [Melanomma pulvis-pyrius CBS 109.77]|uniref:RING-type domain-containing protein n=1 Tax=Melanomma pulvis-pyrius CBS 109.77 TaxID=1314802 RepID=A0A6A6WTY7_9PLEO|nr:hypothetical protein K505DRAFT_367389 [Melanomma pulvis-pyrius CBS 109.77]